MPTITSTVLGTDVTVEGTQPFTKVKDTAHGTFAIEDADGVRVEAHLSTPAEAGYQAATSEAAETVFAANDAGEAAVDEIVDELNAIV